MSELECRAPQDLGAQAERTHLAWTRTGLAFIATAALIMRGAVRSEALLMVIGVPPALTAVLVLAHGPRRYRDTRSQVGRGCSQAAPRLIAATALAACVVSVSGLLTIFLSR